MPFDSQPSPRPPSALFGPLFERVQSERLFADSKTFADLIPLDDPLIILEAFTRAGPLDRAELAQFVNRHFGRVEALSEHEAGRSITDEIEALWPAFIHRPELERPNNSLIQTKHAYVVPGGRFREAYYWDSYFSILGLAAGGRSADAEDIIGGFAELIERFGFIPNGTRSYYLGRSQPPLFYLMTELADPETSPDGFLSHLRSEHAFWMSGGNTLQSGQAHRRVVRLGDGSLLNRYWDDLPGPRDESYAEDRSLADHHDREAQELFKDLRAGAESGWDFSSRWLADPYDLASIRTTAILPIDLNALLWGLETSIARKAAHQGDAPLAETYTDLAAQRARAIRTWLWDDASNTFCDRDWVRDSLRPQPTAAMLAPLFVGLASPDEADAVARMVQTHLLRVGGLATTGVSSGQQWDAPNGWAPLQWMAIMGLTRFGHAALADTITDRWLTTVSAVFDRTGRLFEKYDVESVAAGSGGEYAPQYGFGWTNGVTRALMAWRSSASGRVGDIELSRLLP